MAERNARAQTFACSRQRSQTKSRHTSKSGFNYVLTIRALAFSENLNNVAHLQKGVIQPEAWSWGRRLAWFRIHAWGVCDPGFKSQRPHHNPLGEFKPFFPFFLTKLGSIGTGAALPPFVLFNPLLYPWAMEIQRFRFEFLGGDCYLYAEISPLTSALHRRLI